LSSKLRSPGTLLVGWAALWLPSAALAQAQDSRGLSDGLFLQPHVQVDAVHDSNFFFGSQPIEEHYLRFSPALHAGYRNPRVQFTIGAMLAAELFTNRPQLTQLARKQVTANFGYALSRRMQVSFGSSYAESVYPSEFDEATGIELGRRPASDINGFADWSWQPTRRQRLSLRYGLGRADLEGLFGSASGRSSHWVSSAWSFGFSARTAFQLNYNFRWFAGDVFDPVVDVAAKTDTRSHALAVGLTQQLGRKTSVSFNAGPRLTRTTTGQEFDLSLGERLAADVGVSFQHDWQRGLFSVRYSRQQNPAFNIAGFATTNSIDLGLHYQPHRRIGISISPGVFRNEQVGLTMDSYRAQLGLNVDLAKWLQATTAYNYVAQERTAFPVPGIVADLADLGGRSIRNLWTISLTVGKPIPLR